MKKYLALVLAALLALSLVGCTPREAVDGPSENQEEVFAPWEGTDLYPGMGQYIMTVGHNQPENNPRHISLLQFKEDVENATCGHVRVVVKGDAQLGTEEELLQQTMAGNIQGMRGGQFPYSPRLLMVTLPFLTENRAQITALLQSELIQEVCREAGEQTGTVIINLCDAGGYRQLSNAVRPIHTPEDIRGLTLRTNSLKTTTMTLETLGVKTVPIPYSDLYTALASGVADGQDNPWINSLQKNLHEVQPYFTELNTQLTPDPFFVNAAWWNSLPEEFQTILIQCATDMGVYNDQLIDENNQAAKEAIDAAEGVEIYTPTAEEMAAWRAAVEPVYDQCVAQGICTAEELAQMREIVAGK